MKILKQSAIIAAVCAAAELIKYLLPLPIPASVYGLLLMLAALLTGVIRPEQIETTADFLITIMPVLFVAPTIALVARLDRLGHSDYVTLLPKSVTGAVGMPLAEELGGIGGITMTAISVTGLLGNMIGPQVLRLFRVSDRVAQGVALGCGSHAFGTVRALELGEVEGAMASLSLVITALLTVVIAPLLGNLL